MEQTSGEEGGKVGVDMGGNVILSLENLATVILHVVDPIPPPLIYGEGVEKSGVSITMANPVDPRLISPKVFLKLKKGIIFSQQLTFQIMKIGIVVVIGRILDTLKSGIDALHFREDIIKIRLIPVSNNGLEEVNNLREVLRVVKALMDNAFKFGVTTPHGIKSKGLRLIVVLRRAKIKLHGAMIRLNSMEVSNSRVGNLMTQGLLARHLLSLSKIIFYLFLYLLLVQVYLQPLCPKSIRL